MESSKYDQTYSIDLRERVVAAFVAGEITRVVADRLGIGVSSVIKGSKFPLQPATLH